MALRTTMQPKKPHFFKPIGPGFKKGVKIPESFLKYLGGKVPENLAVLRRGVDEWRVKISSQWLKEGWREFAVENSLEVGDFVVFEHEGSMVFEIMVFDRSHCERDHPSTDDGTKCSKKLKSAVSETEKIPRSEKVKFEQSDDDQEEADFTGGRNCTKKLKAAETEGIPRSKKVKFQDEAHSTDQISYPYFISTVKPTNLVHHRLEIPVKFAKANGLFGRNRDAMLRDRMQKLWSVKLNMKLPKRVCIQGGWKSFAEAQGLKEGDEVVLELTKNGKKPVFSFYGKDEASTRKSGKQICLHDQEPGNPYFTSTIEHQCIKFHILYLPAEFVRSNNLRDRINCKLVLRDPKKRTWHSELKLRARRVCISCGSDKFFTANDLKEGDICSFELVKSGQKPIINFLHTHSTKNDLLRPLLSTKMTRKDQAKRLECSSVPDNDDQTYFVSNIKPFNIKNHVLTLPMEFARANCLTEVKGEIVLKDDRQRPWKVELKQRKYKVLLEHGWASFCRANGLKVGDSYKFEIIKKGKRPVAKFHCNFVESEEESST